MSLCTTPRGSPGSKFGLKKPLTLVRRGLEGAAGTAGLAADEVSTADCTDFSKASRADSKSGALSARGPIGTAGGLSLNVGPVLNLQPKRRSPLPLSVNRGTALVKSDTVAAPYHWRPLQVTEHEQKHDFTYTLGTVVRTLSMVVASKTFEGARAQCLRLEPNNFTPREPLWCYLLGGNFVLCRGIAAGRCCREHDPERGRNIRIARLPEGMRPRQALQFAAVCRESFNVGGHVAFNTNLVTLVVTPDGWIICISPQEVEGAIDLSAVRFATDGGIALMDSVSLHTVDVAGSRLVTLQGTLDERYFCTHRKKPLGILPESCRPPCELSFVVTGTTTRSYHLLNLKPKKIGGVGGDLHWLDSVWDKDAIHLTGIMYEVSPCALSASTWDSAWTEESLKVFVQDFQNFLSRKFGSIEAAWYQAFDSDGSGSVNFTEFSSGCKAAGYLGNQTRLWAALDNDRSGELSLNELDMIFDCRPTEKPEVARKMTIEWMSQGFD